MIVCSCNVVSDRDIEKAIIEIMSGPSPPLPTPGVVWRHLSKRMRCCSCAPIAIETIYAKLQDLEARGAICPEACRIMFVEFERRTSRSSAPSVRSLAPRDPANDDDADPDAPGWLAAE